MGGSDWILIEIMKKLTLQRKNVLQMYVSSESRRSLEGRAGRTTTRVCCFSDNTYGHTAVSSIVRLQHSTGKFVHAKALPSYRKGK